MLFGLQTMFFPLILESKTKLKKEQKEQKK